MVLAVLERIDFVSEAPVRNVVETVAVIRLSSQALQEEVSMSGAVQDTPPVVFSFHKPDRFEVVTGDRLQEWESLMKEKLGIAADPSATTASCTVCYCRGEPCDCDAD